MRSENAKNILKSNMKIAVMDRMDFNPFKASEEVNARVETYLDKGLEERLGDMPEDAIQEYASKIVSGMEIRYDDKQDDFYFAIQIA